MISNGPEIYFAECYKQAREKFLNACADDGLAVFSQEMDATGPGGIPLAIDGAYLGPEGAKKLLVLTSGVHGVELMTGSGCQTGLIADGWLRKAPEDIGILLLHGANPWGAAHLRRNNEDNVDLCRNFVNFDNPPAHNEYYDQIKDVLPFAFADGPDGDRARAEIDSFKEKYGEEAFGRGFMAGQFHDATGVSFGGAGPVWSRRVMEGYWRKYGATAERLCFIDYHSGLGPYAYGTCVCLQEGERIDVARRVFGDWVLAPRAKNHKSEGKAPDVAGHTTDGHESLFGDRELLSVVIEFGVKPYEHTAEILMREHRLHHDQDADKSAVEDTKTDLLRAFYPDDKYWRRAVYNHSLQSVEQALNHLAEG